MKIFVYFTAQSLIAHLVFVGVRERIHFDDGERTTKGREARLPPRGKKRILDSGILLNSLSPSDSFGS